MKEYKLLEGNWASALEDEINELAKDDWIVKSISKAYEGEDNDNEKILALLERDDSNDNTRMDIVDAIGDLEGKVTEIANEFNGIKELLRSLDSKLDDISYNTAKD